MRQREEVLQLVHSKASRSSAAYSISVDVPLDVASSHLIRQLQRTIHILQGVDCYKSALAPQAHG